MLTIPVSEVDSVQFRTALQDCDSVVAFDPTTKRSEFLWGALASIRPYPLPAKRVNLVEVELSFSKSEEVQRAKDAVRQAKRAIA